MKNESIYSSVADIVRTGRKLKGFTQQELASVLRITQGYLSKIESGLLDPNFSLILNYCQVTGVQLDSFNHGFITRGSSNVAGKGFADDIPPHKRAFRPSSREHISTQGVKVRFLIPIIRFAVMRLGRKKVEQICKSIKVDPDILLCHDLEVNMSFMYALAQLIQNELGQTLNMRELFSFSRKEMRLHCRSVLGEEFHPGVRSLDCISKFVAQQENFCTGVQFRILEKTPHHVDVQLYLDFPTPEKKEFEKSRDLQLFFENYTKSFFEFIGTSEDGIESQYKVDNLSNAGDGHYLFRVSLVPLN